MTRPQIQMLKACNSSRARVHATFQLHQYHTTLSNSLLMYSVNSTPQLLFSAILMKGFSSGSEKFHFSPLVLRAATMLPKSPSILRVNGSSPPTADTIPSPCSPSIRKRELSLQQATSPPAARN